MCGVNRFRAYRRRVPYIMRPYPTEHGYLIFKFTVSGFVSNHSAHVLVLEAFVGLRPEGTQGAHWDRDPGNNRLSNLRWATPQENSDDKARHGTIVRGEDQVTAKLTNAAVAEIREAIGRTSRAELAGKYGVGVWTIGVVQRRKAWRHVP